MNLNEKNKETKVEVTEQVNGISENHEIKNQYGGYEDEDDGYDGASKFNKSNDTNSKSTTPILDNFSKDLTKMAKDGKLDPVVGRDKEIDMATMILARRRKNNPVIIGDSGVGKTAIVEGIALRIASKMKTCARILYDKRIVVLDVSAIVAGTKYRGQFEERMKGIMNELEKNPDIILFIDEIHTAIGAGGASGSLDISNMIKPALSRGNMQVIGATTLDEYRKYIEVDKAFARRFEKLMVDEPTEDETITILNNIKGVYEQHHKVKYSDDAITSCVKLATRYLPERKHPDKAIDVLDIVGGKVHIANMKIPQHIVDMEQELEELEKQKLNVVKEQRFEEAASLRDVEKKKKAALEIAKHEWEEEENLLRFDVSEDDVCETVTTMTGIPVTKLGDEETKKLSSMYDNLKGKVIGQDDAVKSVVKAIQRNRVGFSNPNQPSSFMFIGTSGVGKTHLAKALAKYLFGTEDALIREDMSEYSDSTGVNRFAGASAGYVGFDQGSNFLNKVRNKPYSVILLDEIEKAHPTVYNLLLQLLDDGHMTDNTGRQVSFKNTIIIMTSNVGARAVKDFGQGVGFDSPHRLASRDEDIKRSLYVELKKHFAPEFLNRIGNTIYFRDLDRDNIMEIIDINLQRLNPVLAEKQIDLIIDYSIKEELLKRGYDPAMGARPLNRAIEALIEDALTEKILSDNITGPVKMTIKYDKETAQALVTVLNK